MAAELSALVKNGAVRVLDLMILKKESDGSVDAFEAHDFGDDEPGDHAALSIWAPLRGLGLRLHRGSRSAMVCGLSNVECTYEQPADNVDPYPF